MTALEFETVGYADFSLKLHRCAQRRRIPVNGVLEVTRRCPFACVHCYNSLPLDDGAASRELSIEEHCRILDEIAEAGCLWLLLTGGEILARPDFLEIYTQAKRRGFLVTLFTNGYLLTPEVADFLAEQRPFQIELTLYGASDRTYELVTGAPDSYERCARAARLLADRRLPLKVKSLVTSINAHELSAIERFAEELGVGFKFDAMLNARLDRSRKPLRVRLRPEEVVELDVEYPERLSAWREAAALSAKGRSCDRGDALYTCGGGLNSFAIDPYGRLSMCVLSAAESYDLRAGSFHEGWDRFLGSVRRTARKKASPCTECTIKALCEWCPAHGELENGDPEAPVEFFCRVAHLRAHALGLMEAVGRGTGAGSALATAAQRDHRAEKC